MSTETECLTELNEVLERAQKDAQAAKNKADAALNYLREAHMLIYNRKLEIEKEEKQAV